MANKEWLKQLANNAPDELAAWFDAEHVEPPVSEALVQCAQIDGEGRERAAEDDTEAQNADSREQLEADAFAYLQTAYITYPQIIELLDRQAAITAHQWESYHNGMMLEWMAKTEELQEQVDELTSERDKLRSQICKLEDDLVGTSDERGNWKANCEDWKKHARAAENACYETMLEREDYRKKFGKCLDYADAIHALMDDEGMA